MSDEQRAPRLTVELDEFQGLGLILAYPSGVIYTTQAGGYCCLHQKIEGVFVPVSTLDSHWQKLLDDHFFHGPKWAGHCYKGIDEETADFLDTELETTYLTQHLRVDRARLADSVEAWIYVRVAPARLWPSVDAEASGVLTWNNSD